MKKPNLPKSQIQEVLYMLITRAKIDRRQMMLNCDVLNLPEQIRKLKARHLLDITMTTYETFDKYGETTKIGEWTLNNKKQGLNVYLMLQKKNKS